MLKEYENAMCRWQIVGLDLMKIESIRYLQKKVTQNTEWCIGCEKGNVHCSNQTCIQSYQNRQYKIKKTEILTAPI